MLTKLFGLAVAVAGVVALSGAPPARAACNPGTPNCITSNNYWLNNAKKQVHQGDGNFNCAGPDGMCSDDIASPSARTTSTSVRPNAGVSMMTVAPRTRR
jgi:hypothetical protein